MVEAIKCSKCGEKKFIFTKKERKEQAELAREIMNDFKTEKELILAFKEMLEKHYDFEAIKESKKLGEPRGIKLLDKYEEALKIYNRVTRYIKSRGW